MTLQQAQLLAGKVLAGEADPDEITALRQYIHDHGHLPGLADDLLPLKEIETISDNPLPAGMEDRILRPIIGDATEGTPAVKRPVILRQLLRIAAAAAILIGVCLITYKFVPTSGSSDNTPVALLDSISTPAGVRKEITLTDGSRIRLNGGTTLYFPRSFTGNTREVSLDGEAFFEVSKDSSHPFIIHTADFTTTVLGTSFNINSSIDHQHSEVAVATGKVRVYIPGKPLRDSIAYLLPGQKVSYQPGNSNGLQTGSIPVSTIGSWRHREFYYEQASLRNILNDMERFYGVHFVVKTPAILSCTFSVAFKDMKMEEILKSLSLMSKIRFLEKGPEIEVSGPCN